MIYIIIITEADDSCGFYSHLREYYFHFLDLETRQCDIKFTIYYNVSKIGQFVAFDYPAIHTVLYNTVYKNKKSIVIVKGLKL